MGYWCQENIGFLEFLYGEGGFWPEKNPIFLLSPSDLPANKNIQKVNMLIRPANDLNSNNIWHALVFTCYSGFLHYNPNFDPKNGQNMASVPLT